MSVANAKSSICAPGESGVSDSKRLAPVHGSPSSRGDGVKSASLMTYVMAAHRPS